MGAVLYQNGHLLTLLSNFRQVAMVLYIFSTKKSFCLFAKLSLIKELLGMLARLPWGRSDMLGLMNGKYEGVYVKYASLIVSCH